MPMTILIAGATGQTGLFLAQNLMDQGHSVTTLVRKSSDTSAHPVASVSLGSKLTSDATQHLVIKCSRQRRLVVVGGIGGLADQSWKHQTYLPFAHFAQPGTRIVSLVRNDRRSPNTFGQSEFGLNWPRTIATSHCSTWQSTASFEGEIS